MESGSTRTIPCTSATSSRGATISNVGAQAARMDVGSLASVGAIHIRAASSLATAANAGGSNTSPANGWKGRGGSASSSAAGLSMLAAALAVTAQNVAGDESNMAQCCGIAGVVGGENIDAR